MFVLDTTSTSATLAVVNFGPVVTTGGYSVTTGRITTGRNQVTTSGNAATTGSDITDTTTGEEQTQSGDVTTGFVICNVTLEGAEESQESNGNFLYFSVIAFFGILL